MFEHDSKRADLPNLVARNKKCYNWGILGDWTVRLRYHCGLRILNLKKSELQSYAIHPNSAWIGEWNYTSIMNRIKDIGDFNGDGEDDILITSSWGITILMHNRITWKEIMARPKGVVW